MANAPLDLGGVYDTIDAMQEMKRYKAPTRNYFPTAAEIVTYAYSEEFEHMIPYFLWLEECLTEEGLQKHKDARQVLRNIINDKVEKGEIV